jgi:hypothetical protein
MPADETILRELQAMDAALAGEPVAPELTELGALAVALRDQRPRPRPAFVRDLDARAAAGFPRRPRRRLRLPSLPVLLPAAAVAAVAVVVVLAALMSGRHSSQLPGSASSDSASSGASSAPQESRGSASPAASSALPAPTSGSPRADGRSRRFVEQSAALTLVAEPRDIADTGDRIVQVADRLGGFVQSSAVTEGGADAGGEFVLRIPSARLGEAFAQLSRIAHVRERRQSTTDITREHVSATDRLAEHRAERQALLRRLSTATTDNVVADVKARLRRVNRQIAAARSALSRVDNRARYATVDVSLVSDPRAGAAGGGADSTWSPADAAHDALRVLEVAAGVLLVALAIALPLGLVAVLVLTAVRLGARRGRERALDVV